MQTGVWIDTLSSGVTSDPSENTCPRNYKAWEKRFCTISNIPITTYIMCPKGHVHTWDSVYNGDGDWPGKRICGASKSYGPQRRSFCKERLFPSTIYVGEDEDADVMQDVGKPPMPLFMYPVFDLFAQLRTILGRPSAYADLTAYKKFVGGESFDCVSEVYHGSAFRALLHAGLGGEDPLTLDIFLQLYADYGNLNKYSTTPFGPVTARPMNNVLPKRNTQEYL